MIIADFPIIITILFIFLLKQIRIFDLILSFKNPFQTNILVPLFHRLVTKQKKNKYPSGHNMIKNYSGYDHYPLIALNQFRKMNNNVFY